MKIESLKNSLRGLRARAEDQSLPEVERLRAELAYRTGVLADEVIYLRSVIEDLASAIVAGDTSGGTIVGAWAREVLEEVED